LDIAGLTYGDIDHIAVSIKPTTNWFNKLGFLLRRPNLFMPFLGHHVVNAYAKQRRFKLWYNKIWKKSKKPEVHFIKHHLTHVAGSFFVSPYKKAALLGIDGSGEWATTWLGYGDDISIEQFSESFFPHSLGSFYETVTQFCGFKPNYDEGKTMGLAPMGDSSVYKDEVDKMISVDSKGRLKVDLSYFNY
jgi:carbamoyltransferase